MNRDTANAIWDILVRDACARESERETFIRYLGEDVPMGHEYRFMGCLGFGGKLHYARTRGAWIGYYPHDRNDDRDAVVSRVNAALSRIHPTKGLTEASR